MGTKEPQHLKQLSSAKNGIAFVVFASLSLSSVHAQDVDTDGDGFSDIAEGIFSNGTTEVVVNNASFESTDVVIDPESFAFIDAGDVPFWNTTASDNTIEIWQTGFMEVESFDGDQHAELNATELSTLFQDIATEPGTSLNWAVAHRGRMGTDTATFSVGPPEGPYIVEQVMVSPEGFWSLYSGSVIIPEGQTTTRVLFEAISGSTATTGNFIDGFVLETVSRDTDGDGVPDYEDVESDGDGLSDGFEGTSDSDDDGILDRVDLDSDNDGILDAVEADALNNPDNPVDTDADGIFDYLDADSDNDGLSDPLEALGAATDTDRDGIIDDFTDVNQDGLDDSITILSDDIDNIDGDALTDQLDLDTDDDTVFDIVEGGIISIGGVDDNADGILDNMQDLDGDLVPNLVDVDFVGGTDTDGDSIIDQADVDSTGSSDADGDGIDDAGDPDADGNGMADLVSDFGFYSLPDVDEDGIPDVEQVNLSDESETTDSTESVEGTTDNTESDPRYRTSLQGGGCSIATGNGATDPTLALLLALALFSFTCGKRRSAYRYAKDRNLPMASLVVAGSVITLLAPTQDTYAQSAELAKQSPVERSSSNALFGRRYYVGIGSGRSTLEPDTSEVEGVDINDRSDVGTMLSIGMDYSPLVSLELTAVSLGAAGLSNGEEIEYYHAGISSLIYAGGARNRFNRRGFTAFGRFGLGTIINTGDTSVPVENENDAQLTLGLGAEFAMGFGLAFRLETMVFDADANYSQLGVIYRFGPGPQWRAEYVAPMAIRPDEQAEPVIQQKSLAGLRPGLAVATGTVANNRPDQDSDGVMNEDDACANTRPGLTVDNFGCAVFDGVLEDVTFATGSRELTSRARMRLDDVVHTLVNQPSMKVELSAYTDSIGTAADNEALSVQRVESVAIYLAAQGISQTRLSLKAFGEKNPIASNDTAQGRKMNRRVEIKTIQ